MTTTKTIVAVTTTTTTTTMTAIMILIPEFFINLYRCWHLSHEQSFKFSLAVIIILKASWLSKKIRVDVNHFIATTSKAVLMLYQSVHVYRERPTSKSALLQTFQSGIELCKLTSWSFCTDVDFHPQLFHRSEDLAGEHGLQRLPIRRSLYPSLDSPSSSASCKINKLGDSLN